MIAVLVLAVPVSAQNINQSVQVTNEYETKFDDIQKASLDPEVPDSLYRFEYKFDYSVFETPYKGSYEFSPYQIKVSPDKMPYDGKTLYLRAGAGFTFHPILDFAYTPIVKDNFALSIFNAGAGYAGSYGTRGYDGDFTGRDLTDRLGVEGRWLWGSNRLTFRVGYDGIFTRNYDGASNYSSPYITANLKSLGSSKAFFFYDITLGYRYGYDALDYAGGHTGEQLASLGGSFGPVLDQKYGLLIDFLFEQECLKDSRPSWSGSSVSFANIKPHLTFKLGPVDIDGGVRLDYSSTGGDQSFTVMPDVSAKLQLFDDALQIFGGFTGGQRLEDVHSLKSINHFYTRTAVSPAVSKEKMKATAGIGGHFGQSFQYKLQGGYASYASSPLDYVGMINFVNYSQATAEFSASWKSERLLVDGSARYAYTGLAEGLPVYAPAAFTLDARAVYNWLNRIFAGVWIEGSSSREDLSGSYGDIGGWVNLGLSAEYKLNSRLGAWLRLGNLLGMSIERCPGYAEKSPYATVGVSLNL